jgi:hypothetical protein
VKAEAGKSKIAIVGFSESSRHLAPINDPEFEIWSCNHCYRFIERGDVWFELHDHEELSVKYGENWPEYKKWLQEQTMPLYMQKVHPDFPSSLEYPLEEMVDKFAFNESYKAEGGRKERKNASFQSTLSYMLALAMESDPAPKEIHIYGVDMIIDSEWGFQRHNLYYFLGVAQGRGIKLVIPEECALLKEGSCKLYAYEHSTQKYAKLIRKMKEQDEFYRRQGEALQNANNGLVAKVQGIAGAMEEIGNLLKIESLNGEREQLEERLKKYKLEFKKFNDKNEEVVNRLRHNDGARQNNFQWMERLGYNDRGDQL